MATITEAPLPPYIPDEREQRELMDFEKEHTDEVFSQIVADLELDDSIEDASAETERAVLNLVAECWAETEDMPREEVGEERSWLTEVALRAVGGKSQYVREHNLDEYTAASSSAEVASHGRVFEKYRTTELSEALRQAVPSILEEFRFSEKFPDGHMLEGLELVTIPEDAPAEDRVLSGASGALVDLPGNRKGIMVAEETVRRAIEEGSSNSKSLIAHEIGHSLRSLAIGEGKHPLGFMLNELYAEWSGDDKSMYHDEKHMANLLSVTGLNLRKDILPQVAAGEMNMAHVIGRMRDYFGSKNALRLLAYAPAHYNAPDREEPAAIVHDCIEYALQHGVMDEEDVTERINAKYAPHIANIMVSNTNIRRIIPSNLYPALLNRAREYPDFNEERLVA